MLHVQFPEPAFQTRPLQDGTEIFDRIRKKWLLLTPEEWVRQNMINWLNKVQLVPLAFIAVERMLMVGDSKRRFDIVVYSRKHEPWLLVECKAMDVVLNEATLQQALGYFSAMPAQVLMLSNGHHTYAWQLDQNNLHTLEVLPPFTT